MVGINKHTRHLLNISIFWVNNIFWKSINIIWFSIQIESFYILIINIIFHITLRYFKTNIINFIFIILKLLVGYNIWYYFVFYTHYKFQYKILINSEISNPDVIRPYLLDTRYTLNPALLIYLFYLYYYLN